MIAGAPSVRVFHSANQSIADGVTTTLAFNTEDHDPNGFHDNTTSNSRLTLPAAFDTTPYVIGANISWAAGTVGSRRLGIRLNGTTVISEVASQPNIAGNVLRQQITTLYTLASTDYLEVVVTQSQGSALDVATVAGISPVFWMVRV